MKIVIISFFLVVNYTSWNQVTIHRFQDFFFWEFQKKPATTPHLWAFPLHVPGHCAWEPTHHLDCQLELPHTHPHNFFLSNLSFLDICFISNSIPKILWNIQTQSKGVTYEGCITQMYFSILFVGWDNFLLASMPCVHFFAICRGCPALQYHPESPALWTTDAGVLDLECPKFLVTKLNDVVTVLLYRHGNTPLFL